MYGRYPYSIHSASPLIAGQLFLAPGATIMLTQSNETVDSVRAARFETRVTARQKTMLQRAAALSGRTLSEFVVASAQEAAAKVIQEHEAIRLSRAEQIAFVTALLKPRAPVARLRKAAANYKQRMGL